MQAYHRYGPALRRKCERMLGNREDAEDVVQTLFIDLLRKGRTDVDLGYLYRAATTRSLNVIRDGKRRRELLRRNLDRGVVDPGHEGRVLSVDALARLVGELDEQGAELLVYRYCDDMTQEEIAELTGVSRKTVGKRLKRLQARVEATVGEGA